MGVAPFAEIVAGQVHSAGVGDRSVDDYYLAVVQVVEPLQRLAGMTETVVDVDFGAVVLHHAVEADGDGWIGDAVDD